MRKASNILIIIGLASAVFALILFVVMTVVAFMIASPGYTEEIIRQLKDGTITTDFIGTVEEQAAEIQRMFIVVAVVFLLVSIVTAASIVIATMARNRRLTLFFILSIVLGALSGNAFFILGGIFGLLANKEENEVIQIGY